MHMLEEGVSYKGFKLIKKFYFQNALSDALYFKHEKTGAEVLKVCNDFPEYAFCFGFKTPTQDNTGVAHIVEHTVLSGSRKYNVKDPFIAMDQRSLNTFLNAMTGADRTLYPAASLNEEDYFNLMNVYSDAVFFPLLKKGAFLQEGWRWERTAEGKLTLNGIVLNEMKGVMASEGSFIEQSIINILMPNTPFAFNSGGDPKSIPSLSYEDFKDFHKKYYHPSNCYTYLFGKTDVLKELEFLDQEIFNHFDRQEPIEYSLAQEIKENTFVSLEYPSEKEGDNDEIVVFSYLLKPKNKEDALFLQFLTYILLADSSPLLEILLNSGLVDNVSYLSGFEDENPDVVFTLGFTNPKDIKKLEALMDDALNALHSKGINPSLIEAVLIQGEYELLEQKGSQWGLNIGLKLYNTWLYGIKPYAMYNYDDFLKKVQKCLEQREPIFENLIRDYLLKPKVIMHFKPSLDFMEQEELYLKQCIEDKQSSFTDKDAEILQKEFLALQEFQQEDSLEALKTLPVLGPEALPKTIKEFELKKYANANYFYQVDFTNGINYHTLVLDLGSLEEEDYLYIRLLQESWDSLGLKHKNHQDLANSLDCCLGDLKGSYKAFKLYNEDCLKEYFFFKIGVLERKEAEALELLKEMFFTIDWSNFSKIKEQVLDLKNSLQEHFSNQPSDFMLLDAKSKLNEEAFIQNKIKGLEALNFWTKEAKGLNQLKLKKIGQKLESLWIKIMQSSSKDALNSVYSKEPTEKQIQNLLSLQSILPLRSFKRNKPFWRKEHFNQSVFLRKQEGCNFSIAFKGVISPANELLSYGLSQGDLWEKIRMELGAYGASLTLGLSCSFIVYDSPHFKKAVEYCLESLEKFKAKGLTEESLFLMKLSASIPYLMPRSPKETYEQVFIESLLNFPKGYREQSYVNMLALNQEDVLKHLDVIIHHLKQGYSLAALISSTNKEDLGFLGLFTLNALKI